MCPDCFNAHETLEKSFQGHKVTLVKDFKAEDYEALLKRQPFCTQQFHQKTISQILLLTVSTLHLSDLYSHRSPKPQCILLDKAAHEGKENITYGAKMIKEKQAELCEVIKEFEETISERERNYPTTKREVSRTAEQMIANIRQREREVIVSLETRAARLERINAAKQEVGSLVKQINQAAEFAANLVQRSSSSDVTQNMETLKQKFEELRGVKLRHITRPHSLNFFLLLNRT